jgi:hypothetical protein
MKKNLLKQMLLMSMVLVGLILAGCSDEGGESGQTGGNESVAKGDKNVTGGDDSGAGEAGITYKLALEKGKTRVMTTTTDQDIKQTMMGQVQEIKQKQVMTVLLEVTEVNEDGTAWVKYKYDRIQIEMAGPMAVKYDSAETTGEPDNPMVKSAAAMVGKEMLVKMAPSGHVEEVKGFDEILQAIIDGIEMPEGQKQMVAEQIKNQFGEEMITQLLDQAQAILPEKAVQVGDSWNSRVEIEKGLPMIMENTYTLKDSQGGISTIDVSSKILPNEGAPMEMMGTKIAFKLSGGQKGVSEVNEKTGWLVKSTINQDLAGEINIIMPDQQNAPPAIPMEIKSIITVEITDKN